MVCMALYIEYSIWADTYLILPFASNAAGEMRIAFTKMIKIHKNGACICHQQRICWIGATVSLPEICLLFGFLLQQ